MLNEIIKTSLLGTERYMPSLQLVFSDLFAKINQSETDKESIFLKQTASYFILEEGTIQAQERPLPTIDFSNLNEQYITKQEEYLLQNALSDPNEFLFQYSLQQWKKSNKKISPYLVPDIIEKYYHTKQKDQILQVCSGIASTIIALQNQENPPNTSVTEDIEILNFLQIKEHITFIRNTHPKELYLIQNEQEKSWFETVYQTEKADKKLELLQLLLVGLGEYDIPFLNTQLQSKSKNIKAKTLQFLLKIENSPQQEEFSELVQSLFKEEIISGFLGLKKTKQIKLVKDFQLPALFKNYGLEEISKQKGISDATHCLYQCIELMPLSLIAKSLQTTSDDLFQLWYIDWKNDYIKSAIVYNAQQHKDLLLIKKILDISPFHYDLVDHLPLDEALRYFEQFISKPNKENNSIYYFIQWLFNQEYFNLSTNIALSVLKIIKEQQYSIQGNQYYNLGLYLPNEVLPWLDNESKRVLKEKESDYFQRQIHLTQQAIDNKNQIF